MAKDFRPDYQRDLEGKRVEVAKKGGGICLEVNRHLQDDRWVILHKIALDTGFLYYAEAHEVSVPPDHRTT